MKPSGNQSLRVLACELYPLGCVLWKCRAWLHLVDPSLTGPVSALSLSLHCVCPLYRDWTTATSHNNELQRVLEVSEKSHAVIQERCASLLKQHSPHWKIRALGCRLSVFPEWSIVCSHRQFWTGSSNALYSESWIRCGHCLETLSQGHLII